VGGKHKVMRTFTKFRTFLLLLFFVLTLAPLVANPKVDQTFGLVRVPSQNDFATTSKRLVSAIKSKEGLSLIFKFDHSENADSVDLKLRPTVLFIFGNPKAGTPLMEASPSLGIDLPQKMLVVQEDDGSVVLMYNDPSYLASRHGISGQSERLQKISGLLETLAKQAATR
jgi:uncharacterized protein (DUF302 family)